MIISFLNICFLQSIVPLQWTYSKLVTIFKKGATDQCTNYRGIAISNSFAKLLDALMNNRLKQWYKPDPLQAGSQPGRDCAEHILCLRLLIAYAKRKKLKLWLLFIDFRQAYDRVPRDKLLEELRTAGCGARFLRTLKAIYGCTKFILRSAVISATVGVKQGSPMSCLLFVFYLDQMVRLLRRHPPDGFLEHLHCLLYMDDTVLMATSRQACTEKLQSVLLFCERYGMVINETKTKVMVINGEQEDRAPIQTDDITVEHCSTYWYLGSPITSDGSMKTALEVHVQDKIKHVLKFMTFLKYNYNMPFQLKKKVAMSCVMSALLYGCEAWLTADIRAIEQLYGKVVRALLGVKKSTPLLLCLVEADMKPLSDLILDQRSKFMQRKAQSPDDHPLRFALRLTRDLQCQEMRSFRKYEGPTPADLCAAIREAAVNQSRFSTYLTLNPALGQHQVYSCNAKDSLRISFSQLMLSSHHLRIETGRWNRPPTPPRDERVCVCRTGVQTEEHVLLHCPRTAALRHELNVPADTASVVRLLQDTDPAPLLKLICGCLASY